MSVMLKTTNPAAAQENEPDRDRRVPYEGQVLVFWLRPGEGRAGKTRAPAIVTRVEDEDHVEVVVYFAADDQLTKWKIPRKSEQNPVNAWAFNDWDEKNYIPASMTINRPPEPDGHLTWDDVKEMHAEMGRMRAEIADLTGMLKSPGPNAAARQAELQRAAESHRNQAPQNKK